MHRQAVLIQDVLSFREYIKPHLEPIMEVYYLQGHLFDPEAIIQYVIQEEIWMNTQMPLLNHERGRFPFTEIHANLKALMDRPSLSDVFNQLIRVPRIYGDSTLHVALNGRDLTISYTISQPLKFR
jgi:hypothetical protein